MIPIAPFRIGINTQLLLCSILYFFMIFFKDAVISFLSLALIYSTYLLSGFISFPVNINSALFDIILPSDR